MSAKWNPGPWRYSDAGVMSSKPGEGGATVVCEAPIHYLESRRNWDNNAPLIAAAPRLHAACLDACRVLSQMDDLTESGHRVLQELREAIAASEGRT